MLGKVNKHLTVNPDDLKRLESEFKYIMLDTNLYPHKHTTEDYITELLDKIIYLRSLREK